jgi:N-acetylneuraminic acid mutarotase
MADFGNGMIREQAIGFSIGNYGYAGTGKDQFTEHNDFWQYDPGSNTWTQKADYPGQGRYGLFGFGIGNFGYAGTGWSGGGNPHNDFWQYDPSNNTWTAKANFGGSARYSTVGFTIGTKGYAGLGYSPLLRDFWEYDPTANTWTQKANFPAYRQAAIGIGVGNYGYVGTGYASGQHFGDWYEFDPANNTWTAKSPMPGKHRRGAVAFAINNQAFVGMGFNDSTYLTDFSKYDPATDQWTEVASIGGVPRYSGFAFTIGGYGYVGSGSYAGISLITATTDFYRFSDCDGSSVGIQSPQQNYTDAFVSVSADGRRGLKVDYDLSTHKDCIFTLYDAAGKLVMRTDLSAKSTSRNIAGTFSSDIYMYSVTEDGKNISSGKVVVY